MEPVQMMGALWQLGGAAGAVLYLYKLIGFGATAKYPAAAGTVLSAEAGKEGFRTPSGGANTVVTARVRYEYEVNGRRYENDVIDLGGNVWDSLGAASDAARRKYKPGSVVAVYYDPADPKRSFLERSPAAILIVLAGCVAVFIAGGFMRG